MKRVGSGKLNQNDLLALVAAKTNNLVLITDANKKIQWVNNAFTEITGYNLKEVLGKNPKFLQGKNSDPGTINKIRKALGSKKPITCDLLNYTKKGKPIWLKMSISPVFDKSKKLTHFISVETDITALKTASAKLFESEKNLEVLVNSTGDFIWLIDQQFKLIVANNALIKMVYAMTKFKLKKGDYILADKLDKRELSWWKGQYKRAFKGECFVQIRTAVVFNRQYYFETIFNPVLENEKVVAISCFSRDVTEKFNSERLLKEQETRFRSLVEKSSLIVCLLNKNGQINYVSPTFHSLLGYYSPNSMRASIFDYVHTNDIDLAKKLFRTSLEQTDSVKTSFRFICKDGNEIWTEGRFTNLLNESSVKSVVLNMRDVTERKIAVEALKSSEANLRTIIENTKTAYTLIDKNLRLIEGNEAARQIALLEVKKIPQQGEYYLNIIPQQRAAILKPMFEQVLKGESLSYETIYASNKWYRVRLEPIMTRFKEAIGICMAIDDVTEQKTAEKEKLKLIESLAEQNKNHEQFSYIVSHNLRSPVANIIGLVYLLQGNNLTDNEKNKCLEGLSQSAKSIDEVINDLNFILKNRREGDKIAEPVSFAKVLKEVCDINEPFINANNALIVSDFTRCQEMTGVKSYLYSIFYNLITNSIKYKKPDVNPVIEIVSSINSGKIKLVFKDNGIGMDLKTYGDKIFGLYKRFNLSVEGKGMGLFMVKSQVALLGGSINVESAPGKGTCFTLEFNYKNLSENL